MGEGKGAGAAGFFCAVVWFVLIFVTWFISFFLSWFYIILLPFAGCIRPVESLEAHLLSAIQWPMTCAKNMVAMKPVC